MRQNLNNKNQITKQDDQVDVASSLSEPVDYEYKSKIKRFKKKIIFNLSASIFFVVFFFVVHFFSQSVIDENEKDVINLNSKINDLTSRSGNIESRINEIKKYKKIWDSASDKKKNLASIKVSDINDLFNQTVGKYDLVQPKITIPAPEVLTGSVYDNKSFEVQMVNCTIEFQSLTDRVAMNFIDDFLKMIPGYSIISSLEIRKLKKDALTDADLMEIRTGKIGLVSSKVVFSWYFLKNKPQDLK